MSKELDLNRIRERKEKREKRDVPFESVHEELENIKELATEAGEKGIDNNTLNKALLIRTVTCLEVYIRDKLAVVVEYADQEDFGSDEIDTEEMLDHKPDKKLNELQQIAEENLWADLVVSRYKFQNLGGINKAFKDLGVDMLNEIKRVEVNQENGWKKLEDVEPNLFSNLSDALNTRHSITHDINPDSEITPSQFVDYYDAIHMFIDYLDIYIDTQLLDHYGYWSRENVRYDA